MMGVTAADPRPAPTEDTTMPTTATMSTTPATYAALYALLDHLDAAEVLARQIATTATVGSEWADREFADRITADVRKVVRALRPLEPVTQLLMDDIPVPVRRQLAAGQ